MNASVHSAGKDCRGEKRSLLSFSLHDNSMAHPECRSLAPAEELPEELLLCLHGGYQPKRELVIASSLRERAIARLFGDPDPEPNLNLRRIGGWSGR